MSIPVLMESTYPVEVPDVSFFQNYTKNNIRLGIDFARVKASRRVRAVMVKASEGDWDGYLLSDFLEQAEGFANVGLPVLPYHFWHYEVKPADQARRFKSCIGSLSFKPTRFMVDIEDCDNNVSAPPGRVLQPSEYPTWTAKAKKIALQVKNSMDAVSQAIGVAPLWYGGDWYQGWWTWMAGLTSDGTPAMDMNWIQKYDLHCASYTLPWMYLCYGFTKAKFWQWTSTPPASKQIDGFPNPGSLDMNYFIGTEAEFNTWMGLETPAPVELTQEQKLDLLWIAHPALHPA